MLYQTHGSPSVGDTILYESGPTNRVWVVTKIWKGGDRATIRSAVHDGETVDGMPEARGQITRGRFGGWRFGGHGIVFSDLGDPRMPNMPKTGTKVFVGREETQTPWTVAGQYQYKMAVTRTVDGQAHSAYIEMHADAEWYLGHCPVTFQD